MRMTRFLLSMDSATDRMARIVEYLTGQLDSNQWTTAGIAIGQIQELAEHIADLARLSRDALLEDQFVHERRESDK